MQVADQILFFHNDDDSRYLYNQGASNRGCVTTQRSHTQELIVGT